MRNQSIAITPRAHTNDDNNVSISICICIFLFVSVFLQTSFGLSIWQQISKEFFSKLYPSDDPTTSTQSPKLAVKPTTTMHKKSSGKDDASNAGANDSGSSISSNSNDDSIDDDDDDDDDDTPNDSKMESSTKHYRHITLSRGLSKYGPWGYLILGMLLCGGALLVCVLWGKSESIFIDFFPWLFFHTLHITFIHSFVPTFPCTHFFNFHALEIFVCNSNSVRAFARSFSASVKKRIIESFRHLSACCQPIGRSDHHHYHYHVMTKKGTQTVHKNIADKFYLSLISVLRQPKQYRLLNIQSVYKYTNYQTGILDACIILFGFRSVRFNSIRFGSV